ncbi:alanine--tRNA ligase, partial [Candidatus Microgenomates bacterium]|nr:alanine--tRNA ligase [Candidatus Microgenomates bacterium]
LEAIVTQYSQTDPVLIDKFEHIKGVMLEESQNYQKTLDEAKQFIRKKYQTGDELKGLTEISADDAFELYTSHGLSPTQIKSLGYVFDDKKFADKMKEHQEISRRGAGQKFAGGLADHSEQTVKGHTATHLLHQALRDVLGHTVFQTGSNITNERIRFDFGFNRKLTTDELTKIEDIVNGKIADNLPVHFEMLPLEEAKKIGAIGLFDDKYGERVKVYFIGDYSREFCGGPHVDFTGSLKSFKITKEESLGQNRRRIYAVVESSS